jgi:hypothetical protein
MHTHAVGRTVQVNYEMDIYGLEILGLSKARWSENGIDILQSGKAVIYSRK